ncbi:MAG: hypothetical protein OHK0029_24840 [Armatimonadaceae bacterium]
MDAALPIAVQAVTSGDRFYFFGYYDKTPWDPSGRYLLCLQTGFMDRRPVSGDVAVVGVVDLADGNRFIPLGKTTAWNWQQGCMLQWIPGSAQDFIFNDFTPQGFVARRTHFADATQTTEYALPVYSLSPTGTMAASLNFSRLFDARPGYGYAGIPDPWADNLCPENDGLYALSLDTGEHRLILSLADARRLGAEKPGMALGKHRFNHAQWNTDGTRIAVLHRWSVNPADHHGVGWLTRLITVSPNGSDPRIVADDDMVSHYDWRDPQTILAWANVAGQGRAYYLFGDGSDATPQRLGGEITTVDGHCSYSPDRRWILTDTYPDADGYRTLLLFDPITEKRHDIGRFHGPRPADTEIRCDLHPRWNRDGTQICIDSLHEHGHRHVYVLDVSPLTHGS